MEPARSIISYNICVSKEVHLRLPLRAQLFSQRADAARYVVTLKLRQPTHTCAANTSRHCRVAVMEQLKYAEVQLSDESIQISDIII